VYGRGFFRFVEFAVQRCTRLRFLALNILFACGQALWRKIRNCSSSVIIIDLGSTNARVPCAWVAGTSDREKSSTGKCSDRAWTFTEDNIIWIGVLPAFFLFKNIFHSKAVWPSPKNNSARASNDSERTARFDRYTVT